MNKIQCNLKENTTVNSHTKIFKAIYFLYFSEVDSFKVLSYLMGFLINNLLLLFTLKDQSQGCVLIAMKLNIGKNCQSAIKYRFHNKAMVPFAVTVLFYIYYIHSMYWLKCAHAHSILSILFSAILVKGYNIRIIVPEEQNVYSGEGRIYDVQTWQGLLLTLRLRIPISFPTPARF